MDPMAAIKAICAVLLGCLLFFGGRSCGTAASAHEVAKAQRLSDAKSRALSAASRTFASFAATFRAISASTQAQLAEARRREGIAQAAAGHAVAAEANAALRARLLEQQLAGVKARHPDTCAFFDVDMKSACGVTLR